ncbi:MAG: metallophosphoesterase [Bacilli bacterium]|nr:metallophosphoesterase [Bacilli bacterium]
MKTKFLLPILLLSALSACSSNNKDTSLNSSDDSTFTGEFDDNNVIFSSAVISDLHVGYKDATVDNEERFASALDSLKSFHDGDFDAVLSCGDNTQGGTKGEVEKVVDIYKTKMDIDKTPFVFSHGNHDTYWAGCMSTLEFYDAYGEDIYKYDLDQTQAKLGNRYIKINGINIIALQMSKYMPNDNVLTNQTEEWAKAKLDEATNENPNMPVIVLCHSPAKETVYGSSSSDDCGDWGASVQLGNILKDYPNVILFSGHTHYGITDDRNINQSTFTSINAGSVCDIDLDTSYPNTTELTNRRSYGNASILEIDKYGNSRINRYDIIKNKQIKKSWIVPSPKEDLSHLEKYNYDYRVENNSEPEFPENGTFIVKKSSTNTIELEFDAFIDDDMVFAYEMRLFNYAKEDIVDDNDYALSYKVMDDWYNYPEGKTGKVNLITKTIYSTNYTIMLIAIDSFEGTTAIFPTA